MKNLFISIFLIFQGISLIGQELNSDVTVNAPRLQLVDPQVFETLEKEIFVFYNNTKWTEDEYEDFEKIECNINISITEEISATAFKIDVFIQAIRPVFNSNYKTQTLNYVDKGINISYRENQPIQNSFNNYIDPLSSLLSYYAYLILAHDYDTFEPYGGDIHFKAAEAIKDAIPSGAANGTGWDPKVRNNLSRHNLIEELLSPRIRNVRQAFYEYHLKSLDMMTDDANKSRAIMMSAITAINQVNQSQLNSAVVQMFCDSKRAEIIEIFKGASRGDQKKVYDLMVQLDPARASDYSDIK